MLFSGQRTNRSAKRKSPRRMLRMSSGKFVPGFFLSKILPILINVRLDLQSLKHKDQKQSEKIEKVKAPKKGSAPQLKALKTSCMHFWSLLPDFVHPWVSRLFKEKPKKQETKVNQEVPIQTGWWKPIAARFNTLICIGIEILGTSGSSCLSSSFRSFQSFHSLCSRLSFFRPSLQLQSFRDLSSVLLHQVAPHDHKAA